MASEPAAVGAPSQVRRAGRALRKSAAVRRKLDSALVCTHGMPSFLPPPEPPPGFWLEEMDMEDPADIRRWLAVHNAAFGRDMGIEGYRAGIVDHPHYEIRKVLLLLDSEGPLGSAAAGAFRRNPEVGAGHYLAVAKRARGSGLGRLLTRWQGWELYNLGVRRAEGETQISRTASLMLQFALGWEPKYRFDDWNTPDHVSPLVRAITNARLKRLYERGLDHLVRQSFSSSE
jgi:GNAT superfamily N-acetyltransferase